MSLQKAFSKPYLPAILVGKLDNATNAATDKTKKKTTPKSANNEKENVRRSNHSKADGCQSAISYTKKFTHPKQKRSSLNTFG